MPNTCYMLYILAFTHIFLSFQMLHEILTLYWRCSFRQSGQCEGLYGVERVTEQAPRFFIYIPINIV